jgi:catechol 2,3-dioxygenase-like lactoylglutathione lyase family enzyme
MLRLAGKGVKRMIQSIAHICIMTADLEATRKFYGDILKMPCKFRFMKNGAVMGYYFQVSGANFIEVFETHDTQKNPGAIRHVCFEVQNIRSLQIHLRESGLEVLDPKMGPDHTWQLWCKDPNGIDVEFQEYTDKSLQKAGGDCIVDW